MFSTPDSCFVLSSIFLCGNGENERTYEVYEDLSMPITLAGKGRKNKHALIFVNTRVEMFVISIDIHIPVNENPEVCLLLYEAIALEFESIFRSKLNVYCFMRQLP